MRPLLKIILLLLLSLGKEKPMVNNISLESSLTKTLLSNLSSELILNPVEIADYNTQIKNSNDMQTQYAGRRANFCPPPHSFLSPTA